mmetsp:Transcript_5277/g.9440  ORF Transcript_5277/g.9440 Transcript_5277/m.9440 type:complete len:86 (+) Transcript_5277:37-294(+)
MATASMSVCTRMERHSKVHITVDQINFMAQLNIDWQPPAAVRRNHQHDVLARILGTTVFHPAKSQGLANAVAVLRWDIKTHGRTR